MNLSEYIVKLSNVKQGLQNLSPFPTRNYLSYDLCTPSFQSMIG